MLDRVDGVVQVLCILPRNVFAVLEDLSSPQIQRSVDSAGGALNFNKMEMGEVKFGSRFKRLPRTGDLSVKGG